MSPYYTILDRMSDAEALQVATKALDAAREEIDSAKDDLADLVSVTCTSSEMESFAQRVTGIMTNAIQLAGKEFRISELTDADLSDPRVLGYIVKTKELKRTIRGTPSHINCSDGQTIISPGRMNVTAAIRVEKMREVILDASANYKSNPGDAYGRSSDWNGSLMGAIYEAPENAVVICKDLPFQNTWSFTQYGISDQCRVDKSTDKDHDLEKLEFIQVQLQGKNGELVLGTLGLPVYTVEWEKGAPASSGPSPMGRAR